MEQADEATHIIFLGNPGSGKSTLLNGIAQEVIFDAGLGEDGGGLTKEDSVVQAPVPLKGPDGKNYYLCDTPGLMDAKRKKACVDLVNDALGQARNAKIVFVVAWRVLEQDAVAIQSMLKSISAPSMDDKFGLLFNQVPQQEYAKILAGDSEDKVASKLTTLLTGTYATKHIAFLECLDELEEQYNRVPPKDFVTRYLTWLDKIPSIRTGTANAKPITLEGLESASVELRAMFAQLKQENSDLKKKMDDMNKVKLQQSREELVKPSPPVRFTPNPQFTQPFQTFRTPVRTIVGSTPVVTYTYTPPVYSTPPAMYTPVATPVTTTRTFVTGPTTTTYRYVAYQPQVQSTCVQQ